MRKSNTMKLGFLLWSVTIYICSACPVCRDESSVPLPEKPLAFPGFDFIQSCGALEGIARSLFAVDSAECQLIQNMGSYCGCAIATEDPCSLCENDSTVPDDFKLTQVDYAVEGLGGRNLTCELFEAYARSQSQTTSTCTDIRSYAEDCGCVSSPTNEEANNSNQSLVPTLAPIQPNATTFAPNDPAPTPVPVETCPICLDGSSFTTPDKDISTFLNSLFTSSGDELETSIDAILPGASNLQLTCGTVEFFLQTTPSTAELCNDGILNPLRGLCGCPPIDGYCYTVCEDDDLDKVSDRAFPFSAVSDGLGRTRGATCQDFKLMMTHVPLDSFQCWSINQYEFLCGCNGGRRHYLGATTAAMQAALAWVPRLTGLMSLIGSCMIIWDVVKKKKLRGSTYHQLVVGMSVFDIFGSITWLFSTLPIPVYNFSSRNTPTGIYGAAGNDATCKAQGFFFQLGFTGMFYNIALSVYYVLVIKYGVRETRLKKWKLFFHGPPLLVGIGLAFAGIPHYRFVFFACHIQPPPFDTREWVVRVFSTVPIGIATCTTTLCIMFIYYHVWKQDRAADRWRIENRIGQGNGTESPRSSLRELKSSLTSVIKRTMAFGRDSTRNGTATAVAAAGGGGGGGQRQRNRPANRLSESVWRQAVLYLVSFLLTWPIYFSANEAPLREDYGFWLLLVILNPLQGFWNAIIYFRHRIGKRWKEMLQNRRVRVEQRRERDEQRQQREAANSSSKATATTFEKEAGQEVQLSVPMTDDNFAQSHDKLGTVGADSPDDEEDVVSSLHPNETENDDNGQSEDIENPAATAPDDQMK